MWIAEKLEKLLDLVKEITNSSCHFSQTHIVKKFTSEIPGLNEKKNWDPPAPRSGAEQ